MLLGPVTNKGNMKHIVLSLIIVVMAIVANTRPAEAGCKARCPGAGQWKRLCAPADSPQWFSNACRAAGADADGNTVGCRIGGAGGASCLGNEANCQCKSCTWTTAPGTPPQLWKLGTRCLEGVDGAGCTCTWTTDIKNTKNSCSINYSTGPTPPANSKCTKWCSEYRAPIGASPAEKAAGDAAERACAATSKCYGGCENDMYNRPDSCTEYGACT